MFSVASLDLNAAQHMNFLKRLLVKLLNMQGMHATDMKCIRFVQNGEQLDQR